MPAMSSARTQPRLGEGGGSGLVCESTGRKQAKDVTLPKKSAIQKCVKCPENVRSCNGTSVRMEPGQRIFFFFQETHWDSVTVVGFLDSCAGALAHLPGTRQV